MSESFAAGLVGIVLDDRYRLDSVLGEGGMGAVYRAHHLAMDRRVAVKLLKPHLTSDQAALQRFAREARATMRVDSEHAVKVLDYGVTPHSDYYMVLEYLDGRTAQRELDVDGAFEPARVVHIAKQALLALGAAHRSGLVHRDIKPENLLLMRVGSEPDYTKVLDFGVAKLMDGAARSSRSALQITQAGIVFGTPEFMSPEQACGQTLDGRSDLYSLAATMFALLTGCGMYRAKSPIEWLTHHARTPAPHLVEGAPVLAPYTQLDRVLQRCLAKSREDRPQTADEMIELLASVAPAQHKPGARIAAQVLGKFSSSTFVEAIRPDDTLPPAQPSRRSAAAFNQTMLPTDGLTSGTPKVNKGRGVWLVLGALAVVGMVTAAGVIAAQQRGTPTMPVAKPVRDPRVQATPPEPLPRVTDAVQTHRIDAAPPDAAEAAPPDAARAETASPHLQVRIRPDVAKLVADAEDARRIGNYLKQIAKADEALRADPRNQRARFLLADGLLASGDLDRGCKYLRDLRKNPGAQARARQAGCPTD